MSTNEPRSGWSSRKLRDVCTLINGRGFKPFEWTDRGLPIIRIQNLNGSGDYNYYDGSFDPKILVRHGDLLFAWSGSRGASFGPHIWRGKDAVLNYHTWKVVPNSSVTVSFLYHALRGITPEIEASAHGASALVHVQKWEMEARELLFPPMCEQAAITEALADADNLIATLERLIAKKQAIKQGMMQQLFAGRSHAPNRWRECCLGENLLRPPRYGINAAAVPLRPGIATYIRITDINDDGRFDPHPKVGVSHPNAASYILKTGELVLARTGASVGKSYLYDPRDGELVYAGFLINIAPDARQLNPKFLALFMQTEDYWNWVARTSMRSGQPGINGREYAQLPIALPSIDIQNAVAGTFADVDQQIEVLERRLHKSCAIKIGMMQQLLTGRARLRAEAAS